MMNNKEILTVDLSNVIHAHKRGMARFTFLTVILTPAFLFLTGLAFVFAISFADNSLLVTRGYSLPFVTGVNLTLALMVFSLLARSKETSSRVGISKTWYVLGIVCYLVLLFLSYGTTLSSDSLVFFCVLYIFFSFAMLACLGKSYAPLDYYYLGWMWGPYIIDDITTVRDDIDRAHFALGLVIPFVELIVSSYSSIFSDMSFGEKMEEHEVEISVVVLSALEKKDYDRAKKLLQSVGEISSVQILRTLKQIGFIIFVKNIPHVTAEGIDFLNMRFVSEGVDD